MERSAQDRPRRPIRSEEDMIEVLLKLVESAANGGWPAAFAIAVVALALMGCVVTFCVFWIALVRS